MKHLLEGESKLAFLIESGMERASLVLAAQAITDKLQNMAETLAKIEASDVMPMMDSMKENFGQDVATRFENTVSAKLRDLTEALRTARDEIGNEILRMEASVNGEPASDMSMDSDDGAAMDSSDMAMDGSDESDASADANNAPEGDEDPVSGDFKAPGDDENADAEAPTGDDHAGKFDDLFRDAGVDGNSAGRTRKESVEYSGVKALRESANPDQLVVRRFKKAIRSGLTTVRAVKYVAEHFEIDGSDVVDIILERRK